MAPLHLLVTLTVVLIPLVVGGLILYWIIRLAVRHGTRDARK